MPEIFEDRDPSFGKGDLIDAAKQAAPAVAPQPAAPLPPSMIQPAKKQVFLEGDRVRHKLREDRQGKVLKNLDPAPNGKDRVLVQFEGCAPETVSTENLTLLTKGTNVSQALRNDPEALAELVKHVKRIEITGNPDDVDKLAEAISSNSKLTPTDAHDYVKATTQASHGGKFDILIDDQVPADLQNRLGVFFFPAGKGLRARAGELQVNSRDLALWLMKNHDVLPRKWQ
jgi:hypothetical protein